MIEIEIEKRKDMSYRMGQGQVGKQALSPFLGTLLSSLLLLLESLFSQNLCLKCSLACYSLSSPHFILLISHFILNRYKVSSSMGPP